jgi:diaminohydroxyphosphoribosylaminopyrimidine deaminase/5-amino-6-(5-phosphoribosylamino)uracil reductase
MMKYAMTLDGKIATATGKSKWITGEASRQRVQESRNKYMGIMAGINTVLADDPQLTCRIEGGRNPVRIICDTKCRLPLDSNIVRTAKNVRTILAVGNGIEAADECRVTEKSVVIDAVSDETLQRKLETLKSAGVEVLETETKDGHIDLNVLMHRLGEMGIDSVLVEGGGTLNDSLLRTGLVNELNVYIAPKLFGGKDAKTPVEGSGVDEVADAYMFRLCTTEIIDEDILLIYKRVKGK